MWRIALFPNTSKLGYLGKSKAIKTLHLIHTLKHQNSAKREMVQDMKNVKKNLGILDAIEVLFAKSKNCGKWPYQFATIVASAKILLVIDDLQYI